MCHSARFVRVWQLPMVSHEQTPPPSRREFRWQPTPKAKSLRLVAGLVAVLEGEEEEDLRLPDLSDLRLVSPAR